MKQKLMLTFCLLCMVTLLQANEKTKTEYNLETGLNFVLETGLQVFFHKDSSMPFSLDGTIYLNNRPINSENEETIVINTEKNGIQKTLQLTFSEFVGILYLEKILETATLAGKTSPEAL